jgi:excisionase family DNA binding protein
MNFEPLLTNQQAAEILQIHPKTLQKLARAGEVPSIRIGRYWRYRASSIEQWITENETGATMPVANSTCVVKRKEKK